MRSPIFQERPRFSPWIVALGAAVIPLIYLPTLGTRFDFIDDGNLVYPAQLMPLGDRLGLVWQKVVANYEHLGPFRPVLWAHWELFAELSQSDAVRWRLMRLIECMFAAAALLALMRELRLAALPSLAATALAMWNPYRNEIWTSLTLSEGVAMPYALASLWLAARANRSKRALWWDVGSAACMLAALGCKNVFAALIPAQLYLRMYVGGHSWRDGWQRHGRRALFLGLTLLLPIGHYIYFRLNWRPGQYPPTSASIEQLGRLLRALTGAVSIEFLGAGLLLCALALRLSRPVDSRVNRTALTAAMLIVAGGVAVYLPIPAISGRYTMPAVWGVDLAFAALLGMVCTIPAASWRRLAWAGVTCGLVLVAVANVGRQQKVAARIDVLWQTLEYVERMADDSTNLAWIAGRSLNVEEGIHFRWHLQARGHGNLGVELLDETGESLARREIAASGAAASLAVTGSPTPPPQGTWELCRAFQSPYWAGRKQYDSYLWKNSTALSVAAPSRR